MRGSRRWTLVVLALGTALLPSVGALSVAPAAAAASPTLNVGDASVWEGDSGPVRILAIPVTLSDPVTSTVTVSYHLMSGSASAPADFNNLNGATKTLSFAASGAQSKFVLVKVYPDTVGGEGDETFTLMVLGVT
ncbi:MAG: hypothetical protein QOH10_544, partial [Actinomycetota bacterium]|nr:hypothetical protein [Actinomycetota bacterium]